MVKTFQMGAKMTLKDQFKSTISKISQSTLNFKKNVESTNKSVKTYTDSQGRLRDSMGRYVNSVKQAKKDTDRLKTSMTGLGNVAGLVKKAFAVLGIGVAIKKVKSWFIDANADMETYKNTLTTVLKSEKKATETLAWAEKFAAKTPFEIPQIVEATTRMQAYGLNAQKTMGVIGDMASVMGKDLMQAVEAVADAQTGELERLKEFGITKKMIQDQAKAMKLTVINNKGQITDQKAFNAALFKLMEKRFKGGMEMQSKTFKGMVSNVKDFASSTLREMGKPMFDKAKEGLSNLLTWLQKLKDSGVITTFMTKVNKLGGVFAKIGNFAADIIGTITSKVSKWYSDNRPKINKLGAAFRDTFQKLSAIAIPIITWLKDIGFPGMLGILGKVGGWVLDIATWFTDNWSTIEPLITGITIAWGTYLAVTKAIELATAIWTAAQWALNIALTANPIGLIITGIGLLIGIIILLVKNWDAVKQAVVNFFTYLYEKVMSAPDWLLAIVAPILLIVKHFNEIKEVAILVWDTVKDAFTSGVNVAIRAINKLINGINLIPGIQIPTIPEIETKAKSKQQPYRPLSAYVNGSHANGLDRVPFDGYVAELHKNERVLTANEARGMDTKRSIVIQKLIEKIEIHQQPGEDAEGLAKKILEIIYEMLDKADDIINNDEMGVLV